MSGSEIFRGPMSGSKILEFFSTFFPKMIIWVFRLKTRDERGGGLPKGGRGACMRAIDIPDRARQKRGTKNGAPALKI